MPSHDQENYDRALWQSARTRGGVVAELPLPYARAWDAAHAEEAERRRALEASTAEKVRPLRPRRSA